MRFGIVVGASLVLVAAPAAAQSITTGAIKGTVTDRITGDPLPGITVTAGSQTVITEGDGSYAITQLVPGTYDVTFDLGDTKVVRSHVEVLVDSEVRLDQRIKI